MWRQDSLPSLHKNLATTWPAFGCRVQVPTQILTWHLTGRQELLQKIGRQLPRRTSWMYVLGWSFLYFSTFVKACITSKDCHHQNCNSFLNNFYNNFNFWFWWLLLNCVCICLTQRCLPLKEEARDYELEVDCDHLWTTGYGTWAEEAGRSCRFNPQWNALLEREVIFNTSKYFT